ncbi:hypothetical protein F4808DRAFT_284707 [Astrocystis sublimbata]|nr:hypothetical protein F4808DRAFT_284707 [Astrocystis sublimbata]
MAPVLSLGRLLGTTVAFAVTSINLFATSSHAIRLVANPGILPSNIPAACRASLATDITCEPRLIHSSDIDREVPFNATFLGEYCNSKCTSSINAFADGVAKRCGDTPYDFGDGGAKFSGNMIAAPLKWAHDVACIKNTSSFCWPDVVGHNTAICDICTLKHLAGFLGAPYDSSSKIDEKAFSSLVSSCSAKPTDFPHSTKTLVVPSPTPTAAPDITCWGGSHYPVKTGDTCKSIAAAKNMAIDNLLYLNGLDFNCDTLTVGSVLCIRDSCKTLEIQPGDTCKQIVKDQAFTMNEFTHWNPILKTGCDDLSVLAGRTVCITPPGTDNYDVTMTASFNHTFTFPSGSWVPGPTQGTPLGNTTTDWVTPVQTTTLTTGKGAEPTKYYAYCPLDDEVYDEGFDWEIISQECRDLLSPYCDPATTGNPLPSTTFPSSCLYPLATESTA